MKIIEKTFKVIVLSIIISLLLMVLIHAITNPQLISFGL